MGIQITNPSTRVLYSTWRRIRQPFLFPLDKTTHTCDNSWEKFDIDKAGCTECGKYHLCEHGECEYTMTEDSLVCRITGLCVKPKILAADEHVCVSVHKSHNFLQFTSESGNSFSGKSYLDESNDRKLKVAKGSDAPSTGQFRILPKRPMHAHRLHNAFGSNCYEEQMQIVTSTLKHIMCSEKTKLSLHKENAKLKHQLRAVIPQTLRAYKKMEKIPTICDLETQLHRSNNIARIPLSEAQWDLKDMCQLVKQAAIPITRLIIFMRTFCSNVPICVRQNTIVVGLLYMLRRGVVVHNVTVLPKISALRMVLPLEQHLVTVFNIRAKIITEAENVIKFNLRNIPCDVLHLLHMAM
jgi:hypothetical protein